MKTFYLFYDGYELRAVEGRVAKCVELLRGKARKIWRSLKGKQVYTGFYVAFDNLVISLLAAGYKVRVNDFDHVRRNPNLPIGIAGYPSVLHKTASLPNPKLFGPGDPGLPPDADRLSKTFGLQKIIQPCQWFVDLYKPWCGDKMVVWPTGIDLASLRPQSAARIEFDVLIYDKIRWNHESVYDQVIKRLVEVLDSRGLSYKVIRYGAHTQNQFLSLVKRSRSFAFICEHETQGLACQEVMALNVPVFAWDEGKLCDPILRTFVEPEFEVSSVPYWDERCGLRFKSADMLEKFQQFYDNLNSYRPRSFVEDFLSPQSAALRYIDLLQKVAPRVTLADPIKRKGI